MASESRETIITYHQPLTDHQLPIDPQCPTDQQALTGQQYPTEKQYPNERQAPTDQQYPTEKQYSDEQQAPTDQQAPVARRPMTGRQRRKKESHLRLAAKAKAAQLLSKASSVRRVEVNILLKKERAWMHEEIKKGRKDKTMSRAEAKVLSQNNSTAEQRRMLETMGGSADSYINFLREKHGVSKDGRGSDPKMVEDTGFEEEAKDGEAVEVNGKMYEREGKVYDDDCGTGPSGENVSMHLGFVNGPRSRRPPPEPVSDAEPASDDETDI